MSIIKLNNRGVKDATAFGSITSLGSFTFISKQTASSSANVEGFLSNPTWENLVLVGKSGVESSNLV